VSARRQPLVLLAASGLAREVIASAAIQGIDIVGVLDDDPARQRVAFGPSAMLGGIGDAVGFPEAQFVVCAGRGVVRERIVARLLALGIGSDRYATVVDSTAVVPRGCTVGAGSILLSHVSLTADVTVGRHVVIMPQAVLTHDNRIGDFATICAGAALGGNVRVGTAAYVGMNASVRQDLRVGDHATLGMGSVLLRDLPDGRTWAGVPAGELGNRTERTDVNRQEGEPARPAGGWEGALLP
jgi:sugar O-acyltransferase (sialic acid O-acetyltransferase NeuD family)